MKKRFKSIFILALALVIIFKVLPALGLYGLFLDQGTYDYDEGAYGPEVVISDLGELTPKTQALAEDFLARCQEEGLPVLITETYRTQDRQDYLYEQGRTREGPVVTWTRQSSHTDRRAFDICKEGPDPYGDEDFFRRCAEIGLEVGLSPGYYWETCQDKPHFEYDPWWD